MNSLYFIGLMFVFMMICIHYRNKNTEIIKQINKRKNKREKIKMVELAKKFIGKDCIIYTMNSQLNGVITEVANGGILVEENYNNSLQVVNIDYIVRIREYPINKKGKKKAVVLD